MKRHLEQQSLYFIRNAEIDPDNKAAGALFIAAVNFMFE